MNNKIKDLPLDQRPYEKCERFGAGCLADAELLAVLLRTGCMGKQSVELAQEIIKAGGEKGILGICNLSKDELMSIKGVGKVKALQISCVCELAVRITKSAKSDKPNFTSPLQIAEYYMEECRHKQREELKLIMLNSKSVFIGDINISVGTVNSSYASAREVYIEALRRKAVSIILLHNHPSGDPTPSRQDIECTKNIRDAGEIIGIRLIDHIIIGDNKYISFREKGILF